jgi:hypothetical protein
MNENSFGGLQQYCQIKAFTILSGSAGFPGGYKTSPVFFAQSGKQFSATNHPQHVIPKDLYIRRLRRLHRLKNIFVVRPLSVCASTKLCSLMMSLILYYSNSAPNAPAKFISLFFNLRNLRNLRTIYQSPQPSSAVTQRAALSAGITPPPQNFTFLR